MRYGSILMLTLDTTRDFNTNLCSSNTNDTMFSTIYPASILEIIPCYNIVLFVLLAQFQATKSALRIRKAGGWRRIRKLEDGMSYVIQQRRLFGRCDVETRTFYSDLDLIIIYRFAKNILWLGRLSC